jgi:hypothetical protein
MRRVLEHRLILLILVAVVGLATASPKFPL